LTGHKPVSSGGANCFPPAVGRRKWHLPKRPGRREVAAQYFFPHTIWVPCPARETEVLVPRTCPVARTVRRTVMECGPRDTVLCRARWDDGRMRLRLARPTPHRKIQVHGMLRARAFFNEPAPFTAESLAPTKRPRRLGPAAASMLSRRRRQLWFNCAPSNKPRGELCHRGPAFDPSSPAAKRTATGVRRFLAGPLYGVLPRFSFPGSARFPGVFRIPAGRSLTPVGRQNLASKSRPSRRSSTAWV